MLENEETLPPKLTKAYKIIHHRLVLEGYVIPFIQPLVTIAHRLDINILDNDKEKKQIV